MMHRPTEQADEGGWPGLEVLGEATVQEGSGEGNRAEVASLLRATGLHLEAQRYADCGRVGVATCSKCGHRHRGVVRYRCNSRICPECAERKANLDYRSLLRCVEAHPQVPGWSFAHIVLTTKPSGSVRKDLVNIRGGLSRVKGYFRAKRFQLTRDGRKVFAGAGSVEMGEGGMLHCHLVLFVPFIPEAELVGVWGLGFVKAKRVKDSGQLREACRYVLKFGRLDDPVKAVNLLVAMKYCYRSESGRWVSFRRTWTWGRFYGKVFLSSRSRPCPCPCCSGRQWDVDYRWSEPATGPPEILRTYLEKRPLPSIAV